MLHARAQRSPNRDTGLDLTSDAAKKANIGHLKEFYLQRLAKAEPNGPAAARLTQTAQAQLSGGDVAQPEASGQHSVGRSAVSSGGAKDIEDLEIMCNNCFNLILSSEAARCNGDQLSCTIAKRFGGSGAERPASQVAMLDLKLRKLRDALEVRLQDQSSKVNVMRHLTQLRYNIDAAAKWEPGCSEIGALSDHTVQQVKQLTATSRVLAPAVYIFSKRVENVIVQKERELRKAMVQVSTRTPNAGGLVLDIDREDIAESVADVNSIVSELDSNCGTEYAETTVTQDNPGTVDVGNLHDANDYLNLRNEDDQRRWFYSQCLTVKLACADKTRARKILISDLYSKVRAENIPIEGWIQWIREQLMPEAAAPGSTQSALRRPPW